MIFLYLILFAMGFINHTLFTNALPTTTVKSEEILKDQCTEKGNNLKNSMGYIQYITAWFLSSIEKKTEFCTEIPTFQEYLSNYTKNAHLCLEKSEVYMVNFSYQAITGFVDSLCDSNGENINILLSNQSKQCETRLKKLPPELNTRRCIEGIYDILFPKTVSKNICRTAKKTELCTKQILNEYCSEFPSLISLHYDFFKAISKPCNI